jgi:2-polyprenyl-3-methyl-5-hydroxy-6-metoxy-1,4-benzoquinol methylase
MDKMKHAVKERTGEYAKKGDYHKELDKSWAYYPVYVTKMEYVKKFLSKFPKKKKILDVGCGEGILVQEFRKYGYDITGLDLNYSSNHVVKGDITKMPFKQGSFDLVLCLDVVEHLSFEQQELAFAEMARVLKKDGILFTSIPNLSHFASRITFLFGGKLLRTSTIDRHRGDRPIGEYVKIIKRNFKVEKRKGFFPTYPLTSVLTVKIPGKMVNWHRMMNATLALPGFCFLNVIVARKK